MTGWELAWATVAAAVVVIEGSAIATKNLDGTLSRILRRLLQRPVVRWATLAGWAGFAGWFGYHIWVDT